MDLSGYVLVCGMMVGAVTGVTQMIKMSLTIESKYMPWIACLVGVVITLLLKEFTVYSYKTMMLIGFVSGMTSSGFFDLTKVAKSKK